MNGAVRENRNIMFDLLRIIAMLMVLLVHVPMYISLPAFFWNGDYGVAIFFSLSGYLIMESLERTQSVKKYYLKRLIRILPEYYIILIIGIIVWDKMLRQMPQDNLLHLGWFRYFLCLNTVLPSNDYYYWNDLWGLWTISCFMFFYLVAPLIKKTINNYIQSIWLLVLSIIGCYSIRHILQNILVKLHIPQVDLFLSDTPFFNFMLFMIGVSTWYALREKRDCEYLILCIGLIALMIFFEKTNRITWSLIAAIFITLGNQFQIKMKRIIINIIDKISEYSFTIYLIHLPVFQILGQLEICNKKSISYISVVVITVIIVAIAVHNIAEKIIVYNINQIIAKRSQ